MDLVEDVPRFCGANDRLCIPIAAAVRIGDANGDVIVGSYLVEDPVTALDVAIHR